ncbi:MAG: glycosyltransferase family 39 protein [Candidatus Obscuribacterales bacterium]|nr:glycosyltransferase family 39 protein [Candidatus Obscuribacterales bacterium]
MTPTLSKNQWLTVSIIFLIAIVSRALMFAGIDLYADEAYYWLWSQRLAPGFFDNAPLVAWLAAPVSGIAGEFGFRLLFIVVGAVPLIFAALMAHELTDSDNAPALSALLCAVAPMLLVACSLALTDALHIALYSAATWLFVRARGTNWLWLGVAWGLSMLTKWNSLFLAPSVILGACLDSSLRRELLKCWPYLGLLAGLLIFSPFVIWNWQHNWITFMFQFDHATRHESTGWGGSLLNYIASVAVGAGPAVLLAAPAFWVHRKSSVERSSPWLRLASATLLPFLSMGCLSIVGKVEFNWPAMYYPGLLAAAASFACTSTFRWSRPVVTSCVILSMMAVLLYGFELRKPTLLPATSSMIHRFHGWPQQARALAKYKDHYVITSNYQIASHLAYYGGFHRFSPTFGRASQFNIWNETPLASDLECLVVSLRPLTDTERQKFKVKPSSEKTLNAFFSGTRIRRLWLYLTDGAPDMQKSTSLGRWVDP